MRMEVAQLQIDVRNVGLFSHVCLADIGLEVSSLHFLLFLGCKYSIR